MGPQHVATSDGDVVDALLVVRFRLFRRRDYLYRAASRRSQYTKGKISRAGWTSTALSAAQVLYRLFELEPALRSLWKALLFFKVEWPGQKSCTSNALHADLMLCTKASPADTRHENSDCSSRV